MISRIIAYSIRNPFVVIALAFAVAAIGVYSMFRTPIDAIPDLSENQVIVFADWMGAARKRWKPKSLTRCRSVCKDWPA